MNEERGQSHDQSNVNKKKKAVWITVGLIGLAFFYAVLTIVVINI